MFSNFSGNLELVLEVDRMRLRLLLVVLELLLGNLLGLGGLQILHVIILHVIILNLVLRGELSDGAIEIRDVAHASSIVPNLPEQ